MPFFTPPSSGEYPLRPCTDVGPFCLGHRLLHSSYTKNCYFAHSLRTTTFSASENVIDREAVAPNAGTIESTPPDDRRKHNLQYAGQAKFATNVSTELTRPER